MTLTEIVTERLERLRLDIIARMDTEHEQATGRTAESFEVVVDGDRVALYGGGEGASPLAILEVGRRPGAVPITPLIEWAKAKEARYGVTVNPWAVRAKIMKEGTDRYHEPVDIYSSLVLEAAEDIEKLVTAHVVDTIKTHIQQIYG